VSGFRGTTMLVLRTGVAISVEDLFGPGSGREHLELW
jgi:hypothetical protein